jgi:hypothetical protein
MSGEQPKLCRDCTHLAKSSVGDAASWKCMAPQNITSREVDLVNGETVLKRRWLTCYEARADGVIDSCGSKGQWFEPAPPRFLEPSAIIPSSVKRPPIGAADLLSQLDSMK